MIATVPIVIPRWTHEIVKIQMDALDLITALDSSDIERREVLGMCVISMISTRLTAFSTMPISVEKGRWENQEIIERDKFEVCWSS